MRRGLYWVLLVVAGVGAVALEDPTPVLVVVAAAVLVMPRSDWKRRPKGRARAADWVALAVMLAASGLTLLIPDGVFRWVVITAIVIAYVVSWRLLDRASADSGSRSRV